MNWKEFLKVNETVEGLDVWIVDARLSDGNKFIRHVPPTLVKIVSNAELPKGKTVYYSDFHFKKYGKSGRLLKQIISPFDNTGYRSHSGVSVNVFLTYDEAAEKYNQQLEQIIESYASKIEMIENEIKTVQCMKIK